MFIHINIFHEYLLTVYYSRLGGSGSGPHWAVVEEVIFQGQETEISKKCANCCLYTQSCAVLVWDFSQYQLASYWVPQLTRGPAHDLGQSVRYFLLQELGKCHKCGDTEAFVPDISYIMTRATLFNFIHIMQVIGMFLYFNTTFKNWKLNTLINSHPEILYMLLELTEEGQRLSSLLCGDTVSLESRVCLCCAMCLGCHL